MGEEIPRVLDLEEEIPRVLDEIDERNTPASKITSYLKDLFFKIVMLSPMKCP